MSGTVKKLYEIEQEQLRINPLPDFQAGDTVGVHYKIREGEKERIQLFEGVCIQRHNGGLRSTFTVRKVSNGIGVERVFPLHSPRIDRLEVKMRGKVKQARLQYLRERSGKSARIRERGKA
ncbi:MAG: 50S ribosomal protein L19 [Deltaproteobacteria bacterium]|nr:50S ribosomal protein L19 [Deltaproteobacteria bacterium]MBN2671323.1 50S ribosomal protein L19 [Deltaproteobacteria bacterium]